MYVEEIIFGYTGLNEASQVALVVKNPPDNAGNIRDLGSVPGLGRSPGEGNATHSSILAWKIPWTEKPVGLQRVRHDLATKQQDNLSINIFTLLCVAF